MIRLFGNSQILRSDEWLDVFRERPAEYSEGKPVKQDPVEFRVRANVQPVNGRDLLIVPEHDRFKEQLWLYMDNKQFDVNQGLDVEGPSRVQINDRVVRLGVNYQTQTVENWGSYTRARVMRIDVGPEKT